MQRFFATGNIGKDAEIRKAGNGDSAIGFSLCVNKVFMQNNVRVEQPTWFDCTYWRRNGESTDVAQYLKKGTRVAVSGEVGGRAYVDDKGQPAYSITVNVGSVELQGAAPKTEAAKPQPGDLSQQDFSGDNLNEVGRQGLPASNFEAEAPAASATSKKKGSKVAPGDDDMPL